MEVVSFTPRPLYPQGKSPWYPLDRKLGGPQSRSEPGGEEKNSQPLPGLKPPIIQLVAQRYTAELSRLLISALDETKVIDFPSQKTVSRANITELVTNDIRVYMEDIHVREFSRYSISARYELESIPSSLPL
jgi:hypothetical protein